MKRHPGTVTLPGNGGGATEGSAADTIERRAQGRRRLEPARARSREASRAEEEGASGHARADSPRGAQADRDNSPGATLLVNHHQRKAEATDFIDAVSGTAGLAGAADTIIVLARDRQEAAGLVKVTGRDVAEGEYAVTFKDGAVWELDGHDLEVAREKAQKVRATTRATAAAGDRMLDVVLYAYEHPDGVRRGDVAKALKLEPSVAGVYLARAVDTGRLQRAERGPLHPCYECYVVTSRGQRRNR